MMGASEIPAPREDDCEDVHWALTTARSLRGRGEPAEALRWLRRAVGAAVAADRDARAIALGKAAADLQEALGGARTEPGAAVAAAGRTVASGAAPISTEVAPPAPFAAVGIPIDGLDEPTHVDSRPPAPLRRESRTASVAGSGEPGRPVSDEITLIPGTKKAADAAIAPSPSAQRPPTTRTGDTSTMPAYRIGQPFEDEAGEVTTSMQRPPNMDELIDAAEREHGAGSVTRPAMAAVHPTRVALLASADGGAPRVILLAPGAPVPPGAAVAALLPASRSDAQRAATLLRAGTGDDREE